MRNLSLDEREELEDIEIAINKEFEISDNEERDFFFPIDNINYGQIILNKNYDKYIIDICSQGFLIENPDVRSLYEDKEFSKDELIDFLKNFEKEISPILQEYNSTFNKPIEILIGKKLNLLGVNLRGRASLDDSGDYELEKHKELDIILYIEDSLTKTIYRIVLMNTYGMCGSGWTTASWGEVILSECKTLPKKICYLPLKQLQVEFSLEAEGTENETVIFKINADETFNSIYCCYDGGDSYYPSGYIEDRTGFLDGESRLIKKYFSRNISYIQELKELKERIPLEIKGE